MKIIIAGGTGLLGSEAARIMIDAGHEVHAITLPFKNLNIPKEMILHELDFIHASDEKLDHLMHNMDAFVFAVGVDERIEFKKPVFEAYEKYNIVPLYRLLSSAKRCNVKKAIVLGSYFSYFAKNLKEFRLEEYHPYIKSRIKQENTAFSLADDSFSVVVLELPYIFGIQEGRKPVWSIFIERFHRPKIIFFPKGGTSMVTLYQVGIAIYHAILYGENKTAYPLGYVQMPWRVLIKKVLSSMKQKKLIITVPNWMAQLGFNALQKSYEKKGIEPGLNPKKFIKLMSYKTYIDPALSKDLRIPDDDINKAIDESITYAYRIYLEKLEVTDMKVSS